MGVGRFGNPPSPGTVTGGMNAEEEAMWSRAVGGARLYLTIYTVH